MESFAVSVMPVAQPDEWRAFAGEIVSGDRAEAHREMLRRLRVEREHLRMLPTPAEHVIPHLHGIDLSAGPPPAMEKVGTIET